MSRLVAAVAALLLATGTALAQAPGPRPSPAAGVELLLATGTARAQAQGQGPSQAPVVDPGTKLSFAASVGGATLARSFGSTYQYLAPNGMEITVDVYDGGRRVPNGSSHPTIINQFNDELATISQQA